MFPKHSMISMNFTHFTALGTMWRIKRIRHRLCHTASDLALSTWNAKRQSLIENLYFQAYNSSEQRLLGLKFKTVKNQTRIDKKFEILKNFLQECAFPFSRMHFSLVKQDVRLSEKTNFSFLLKNDKTMCGKIDSGDSFQICSQYIRWYQNAVIGARCIEILFSSLNVFKSLNAHSLIGLPHANCRCKLV